MHFVLGHQPRLFPLESTPVEPVGLDVEHWVESRQADWARWRDRLWASKVEQALQYNKRRGGDLNLEEGNLVLIDAENRAVTGGKVAKLRARYEGPFKVLQVLNGGRDARLALPAGDKSHDIFHVSKLKVFKSVEGQEDNPVEGEGLPSASKSPPF